MIAEAYDLLRRYLPVASVYYAVKANPAAEIVAMLAEEGLQFRRREPGRNPAVPGNGATAGSAVVRQHDQEGAAT